MPRCRVNFPLTVEKTPVTGYPPHSPPPFESRPVTLWSALWGINDIGCAFIVRVTYVWESDSIHVDDGQKIPFAKIFNQFKGEMSDKDIDVMFCKFG